MGLVLDVGCGLHPRGDVNTDPYPESIHRRGGKGPTLDETKIIQCYAEHMPMFRDRQFEVVRCHQVLEHIADWRKALREMWRVCDYHLIVEVPDRRYLTFPKLSRSKVHISNFDAQTMDKVIPLVLGTRNFEVSTRYKGLFHKLLPFPVWPELVRVDVWRDHR
jgi:ubiquinone/menaquinone biosynthesis C-methylase UbiE